MTSKISPKKSPKRSLQVSPVKILKKSSQGVLATGEEGSTPREVLDTKEGARN